MELITRQSRASTTAARWQEQYNGPGVTVDEQEIGAALVALGADPLPDAVDAAIGNDSWTKLDTCGECSKEVAALVQVGEDPDYDSNTAYLCKSCTRRAVVLFED